ncbi:hypothetical protein ETAA8_32260 [Anatilimnocola aggregata]|uniref:TfoX N-terminal domain-containing protein n=1 Tax=Anatilimnocola aggregata TaxID=2528021 RepID=A0A517YD11_9BACT|nr:TfoX/Sxy family protein [Anatilimnocola aggregata]QDU28126.1 hypothetical protein ETAA8_32260 [Anatilimnocola aggregata]
MVHNKLLRSFFVVQGSFRMPVSLTFRQWVRDQLQPSVRGLRDRSMFGGVGIYAGDWFFALLAEDRLYLKVDDSNRADFVAAGMGPFHPFGDDRLVMQYYEVPLEVIEKQALLAAWAAKAIAVAMAAKKPKKSVISKPAKSQNKIQKKTTRKTPSR